MFNLKKHLGSYAIEFILLFSAVTLGFFAENYRESQVERKTERMYLQSLLEDLGQDTVKIDFSIQSKLTKDAYFDTLHQIIYQTPKPWPTRKLYYISRYLLIREHFYGTEGTIKQLENSGGFKLLRNHDLVDKINAYSAAKEKLYQIQIARDLNAVPFKEAIGHVFQGKELAFLFDQTKGDQEDLEQYFYWASNEIFIERNCRALLGILRVSAKDLIHELEKELQQSDS